MEQELQNDYDQLVILGFPPEEAVEMVFYKQHDATISDTIIKELLDNKKRYNLTEITIELLNKGSSQELVKNLTTYAELRSYRFEKYLIPKNVPINAYTKLQRRNK